MGWNTWLRFKMKAIFEWSVRAPWTELEDVGWYFYIDDDTHVLPATLLALLRKYDPTSHTTSGGLCKRRATRVVGGGAGIVLSRGGARDPLGHRLRRVQSATPQWGARTHQGGDAWLGDCAEVAGVHTEMEYGFYPQPPVADLFHLYADAVAFHGVEDHKQMHASLAHWRTQNATSRQEAFESGFDPRCVPVFVDHKYTCLPHFIIGGVPKAGTTSLYKYLMQHPEVLPAKTRSSRSGATSSRPAAARPRGGHDGVS